MDGKIDTVREALDEIQNIKWLIDEGPAHVKLTEAQTRLTELAAALSAIDPEAIRRECAEKAWPLLKQEYEWRSENSECGSDEISEGLDMLRFRLEAAILSADPAQDGSQLKCGLCGNVETPPYAEGDACYCGGEFKPAQDDGKPEVATFEEMKDWLIRSRFKSEYIQASIVMLRTMFEERAAEVKRHLEEAKE